MTDKSNMVPTTDFSKSSTKFHGTEGLHVAVLLQRHILMELGKRNEAHFLTTPCSKIIDEAMQRITGVTAQSSTDIINAEKYRREIFERWAKAYWTFRDCFALMGQADKLLRRYDENQDLNAAWEMFVNEYIGGRSLHGALMTTSQFFDKSMESEHFLDDFLRRMKILHDLEKISEEMQSFEKQRLQKPAVSTPILGPSPISRKIIYDADHSEELEGEGSASGGNKDQEADKEPTSNKSSTSSAFYLSSETKKPMELTTTISEWVKVLLVLFQMRESAKHGTVTSEFIEKYILERTGEQNSVFALGETLIYDQMRTFSQIRASKSVQINYTKAHVPESHKREKFVACGEAECDAKGHIHSAAKCWVKHPERRPPHLKNADKTGTPSTPKTKNDSTSGKKEKFRRRRFKGKKGRQKSRGIKT